MKYLLKHIWFLFVFATLGISWMLCTLLILGQKPYFITTEEQMLLTALLLPAIIFISGTHLMWILNECWLTKD